jgi:branched-chain amino acid transport system ATP-binding protein
MVERTFEIIAEIRKEGTTVLMVEQNAYAALEMCDRSYVLESGEVALQGTGAELLGNPHVRQAYLGGGYRAHQNPTHSDWRARG